jgi:6,7-dimethyl-8-ribityllumazine synthase
MAGRYAIIAARFYPELAEALIAGARNVFEADDADAIDVHSVPGAFELPLAAQYAASSGRYRGIACVGAVIRGETDHYDYVCAETARGIQNVALQTGVPCGFGVLTVASMDQALARADGTKRDQGAHAARAVLALAELRDALANG